MEKLSSAALRAQQDAFRFIQEEHKLSNEFDFSLAETELRTEQEGYTMELMVKYIGEEMELSKLELEELKSIKSCLSKKDWMALVAAAKEEKKRRDAITTYQNSFRTAKLPTRPPAAAAVAAAAVGEQSNIQLPRRIAPMKSKPAVVMNSHPPDSLDALLEGSAELGPPSSANSHSSGNVISSSSSSSSSTDFDDNGVANRISNNVIAVESAAGAAINTPIVVASTTTTVDDDYDQKEEEEEKEEEDSIHDEEEPIARQSSGLPILSNRWAYSVSDGTTASTGATVGASVGASVGARASAGDLFISDASEGTIPWDDGDGEEAEDDNNNNDLRVRLHQANNPFASAGDDESLVSNSDDDDDEYVGGGEDGEEEEIEEEEDEEEGDEVDECDGVSEKGSEKDYQSCSNEDEDENESTMSMEDEEKSGMDEDREVLEEEEEEDWGKPDESEEKQFPVMSMHKGTLSEGEHRVLSSFPNHIPEAKEDESDDSQDEYEEDEGPEDDSVADDNMDGRSKASEALEQSGSGNADLGLLLNLLKMKKIAASASASGSVGAPAPAPAPAPASAPAPAPAPAPALALAPALAMPLRNENSVVFQSNTNPSPSPSPTLSATTITAQSTNADPTYSSAISRSTSDSRIIIPPTVADSQPIMGSKGGASRGALRLETPSKSPDRDTERSSTLSSLSRPQHPPPPPPPPFSNPPPLPVAQYSAGSPKPMRRPSRSFTAPTSGTTAPTPAPAPAPAITPTSFSRADSVIGQSRSGYSSNRITPANQAMPSDSPVVLSSNSGFETKINGPSTSPYPNSVDPSGQQSTSQAIPPRAFSTTLPISKATESIPSVSQNQGQSQGQSQGLQIQQQDRNQMPAQPDLQRQAAPINRAVGPYRSMLSANPSPSPLPSASIDSTSPQKLNTGGSLLSSRYPSDILQRIPLPSYTAVSLRDKTKPLAAASNQPSNRPLFSAPLATTDDHDDYDDDFDNEEKDSDREENETSEEDERAPHSEDDDEVSEDENIDREDASEDDRHNSSRTRDESEGESESESDDSSDDAGENANVTEQPLFKSDDLKLLSSMASLLARGSHAPGGPIPRSHPDVTRKPNTVAPTATATVVGSLNHPMPMSDNDIFESVFNSGGGGGVVKKPAHASYSRRQEDYQTEQDANRFEDEALSVCNEPSDGGEVEEEDGRTQDSYDFYNTERSDRNQFDVAELDTSDYEPRSSGPLAPVVALADEPIVMPTLRYSSDTSFPPSPLRPGRSPSSSPTSTSASDGHHPYTFSSSLQHSTRDPVQHGFSSRRQGEDSLGGRRGYRDAQEEVELEREDVRLEQEFGRPEQSFSYSGDHSSGPRYNRNIGRTIDSHSQLQRSRSNERAPFVVSQQSAVKSERPRGLQPPAASQTATRVYPSPVPSSRVSQGSRHMNTSVGANPDEMGEEDSRSGTYASQQQAQIVDHNASFKQRWSKPSAQGSNLSTEAHANISSASTLGSSSRSTSSSVAPPLASSMLTSSMLHSMSNNNSHHNNSNNNSRLRSTPSSSLLPPPPRSTSPTAAMKSTSARTHGQTMGASYSHANLSGGFSSVSRICVATGTLVKAQEECAVRVDVESACVDVVWKVNKHQQQGRGTSQTHSGAGTSIYSVNSTLVRQSHPLNSSTSGSSLRPSSVSRSYAGESRASPSANVLRRERFRFNEVLAGKDARRRFSCLVQAQVRAAVLSSCVGMQDDSGRYGSPGGREGVVRGRGGKGGLTYVLTGCVAPAVSRGNSYPSPSPSSAMEYTVKVLLGAGSSTDVSLGGTSYPGLGQSDSSTSGAEDQVSGGLISTALGSLFHTLNSDQLDATSTSGFRTSAGSGMPGGGGRKSTLTRVSLSVLHVFGDEVVDLLRGDMVASEGGGRDGDEGDEDREEMESGPATAAHRRSISNSRQQNQSQSHPQSQHQSSVRLKRKPDGSLVVSGAVKAEIKSVGDYDRLMGVLLGRRASLRLLLRGRDVHGESSSSSKAVFGSGTAGGMSSSFSRDGNHFDSKINSRSHIISFPTSFSDLQKRNSLERRNGSSVDGYLASSALQRIPELRWALGTTSTSSSTSSSTSASFNSFSMNATNSSAARQFTSPARASRRNTTNTTSMTASSSEEPSESLVVLVHVSGRCLLPSGLTNTLDSRSGPYTSISGSGSGSGYGSATSSFGLGADKALTTPIDFRLSFITPCGRNWNKPDASLIEGACQSPHAQGGFLNQLLSDEGNVSITDLVHVFDFCRENNLTSSNSSSIGVVEGALQSLKLSGQL